MSTSWTPAEDQQLMKWAAKGEAKGWDQRLICLSLSEKLERTAEECEQRLHDLQTQQAATLLKGRVRQLEKLTEVQQAELEKVKKDLKFYELMLLEQYHLLLRLLGEDQQKVKIHSS